MDGALSQVDLHSCRKEMKKKALTNMFFAKKLSLIPFFINFAG